MIRLAGLADATIRAVRAGFTWWLGELGGLVPPRVK